MKVNLTELQLYNPSHDMYVTFRRNSIYIGKLLSFEIKYRYCHVYNHQLGIIIEFTNVEDLSTLRVNYDREQKRIKLLNFCSNFDLKITEQKYRFEQVDVDGKTNTWIMLYDNPLSSLKRIKSPFAEKRIQQDFDIGEYQIKICDKLLKKYRYAVVGSDWGKNRLYLSFSNSLTGRSKPILKSKIFINLPPIKNFTYTCSKKENGDTVYTIEYDLTVNGFAMFPISDVLENEELNQRNLFIASRNRVTKQETTLINLVNDAKDGIIPIHPFIAIKSK
jgi:hypothetical protein